MTARILIIDDDDLVRATLTRTLTAEGHDIVAAADGREGIAQYHKGEFDLVITDILMPEKEGLETIQELRRAGSEVKIIAISGGDRTGNMSYLKMAGALGADGVLAKPVRRQDLLAEIDAVLKA